MPVRSFLTAAMCGSMLVGPAFGHAKLRSTMPAADARVATAPTSLILGFNEPVRVAVLTLTLADANIALKLDPDAPAAAQITVPLPALSAGTYRVRWSALTPSDGHVVKGEFSFTILKPASLG